jgi:hypothetical protein
VLAGSEGIVMLPQYFTLWKDQPRDKRVAAILKFISGLALNRAWEITVKPYHKKRSVSQNNYLWGVVYPTILKGGGETLAGWTADDLHEYFLAGHFGSEVLHFNGRDYERPLKRSSKLTTLEFMDFVAFIQQKMAELGIFIPDPDPQWFMHQEKAA